MDLIGLLDRVGYPMLLQIIIECWNEVFLLLLIIVMSVGRYRDRVDELVSRVKIPLTSELIIFYTAIFFYNFANIITLVYGGYDSARAYFIMRIGVFFYYLVGAFQTVFFLDVIKTYIARENKDKRLERVIIVFQLLEVPNVLLLLATPFTKALYFINANNEYNRSWGYYVWQGITILTFLFIGVVAIIYRKKTDRFIKQIIAIAFLFPMAGFVMSLVSTKFNFNNIMVCVSELLMFMLYEKNKTEVTLKYGYELEKAKSELAENRYQLEQSRNKVLISQIQPHFIYNALMAIREQCIEYPEVYSSVTDFSHYLRANLEGMSENMTVTFEKELRNVEAYLALEKLNFGERLKIEYDIESRDFLLPELSVQPLVENAVRHGIGTKKNGGTVMIVQRDEEERIVIEVIDDGEGKSAMTEQQEKRRSVGIENVRARLKALNKGELEIIHTDSGTTARIIINEVHYEGE